MPLSSTSLAHLAQLAQVIRRHIIEMVEVAQSGHPGASLSAVEMVTALYFSLMRIDPKQPQWSERDRFVLSKGHATPVLYAVLAERGYFPTEELATFRQINSRLQGHPDMTKTPGVDMTTGSLGQGFASSIGMALALRQQKNPAYVYPLIGDGELNEGIIWEAAMIAAHYQLDHVIAFLDKNGKQACGYTNEVMNTADIVKKWQAFGWHTLEIDGHDFGQIISAVQQAKGYKAGPTIIIANTIKGKGIPFMERGNEFYGETLSADDIRRAKWELLHGEG